MEAHVCQPMHAQNHTDINKSRHKYMPHLSNHAGGVNIYLYGWVSLLAPLCCVCVCVCFLLSVCVCMCDIKWKYQHFSQPKKQSCKKSSRGGGWGQWGTGAGFDKIRKKGVGNIGCFPSNRGLGTLCNCALCQL